MLGQANMESPLWQYEDLPKLESDLNGGKLHTTNLHVFSRSRVSAAHLWPSAGSVNLKTRRGLCPLRSPTPSATKLYNFSMTEKLYKHIGSK